MLGGEQAKSPHGGAEQTSAMPSLPWMLSYWPVSVFGVGGGDLVARPRFFSPTVPVSRIPPLPPGTFEAEHPMEPVAHGGLRFPLHAVLSPANDLQLATRESSTVCKTPRPSTKSEFQNQLRWPSASTMTMQQPGNHSV
jgi:hypothetical protein